MARYLKQINDSEKALTVGSLKVIGDISNSGLQTIKKQISSLATSQQTTTEKQNEYWSNLSSDNVITPGEKITLKKEWATIQNTYSALTTDLEESILATDEVQNYILAYTALKTYLFSTIKVFDDMTANTVLEDSSVFNNYYSSYYYNQTLAQNRITIGLVTRYGNGLRTLTSLEDVGLEGEIAIYAGGFYQYDSSSATWTLIDTQSSGYKGSLSEPPSEAITGDYFYLNADFIYEYGLVTGDGELLSTNSGALVTGTYLFKKGYVYLYSNGYWHVISDTNDFRYTTALLDVMADGGEVPEALKEYLTDSQDDYWSDMSSDDVITAIEKTSLYNEWLSIKSTYQMIVNKLSESTDSYYTTYVLQYMSLSNLLTQTLKLFDDMTTLTRLSDYSVTHSQFNSYYENYYNAERYALALYSQTTAEEAIAEKIGTYLGRASSVPTGLVAGDYFVWGTETCTDESQGVTTSSGYLKMGYIYKYLKVDDSYVIQELDATEQDLEDGTLAYSQEFMTALTDILYLNSTGNAYFSAVFAKALYASAAFITSLQTRTIQLQEGGNIQSNSYTHGVEGFNLDYEGNAHFEGDTHIGGTCTIDGTTSISGNASVTGNVTATAFQIEGVQPGNVVLRNLGSKTCDSETSWDLYSQIVASGTVRVRIIVSDYYKSFYLKIGTVSSVSSKTFSANGTYDYDVEVSETNYLHIGYSAASAGMASITYGNIQIYILTNSNNNVLAYLGTFSSTTSSISPAR